MNLSLIKRRLGWYGLAWIGGFLLVLLASLIAFYGPQIDIIDSADWLIPLGLGALTLGVAGVVIRDLISKQSLGTRLVILLLAALLYLPLLWSPVAGAVASAWIADRPIEYSTAYAQFRINVSHLLYPLVDAVSSGAAFELVWQLFQLIGTIVGFLSSLLQIIGFFRRLLAAKSARAFVEEMTAPPEEPASDAPAS
ncbi:hypothetical protein GVN21_18330 [Caulobacter sp. SLTY]|uniref:hypothetical protein n=1 Tax=Caulobacter sp. SLTY TaxID=2683262 RepID=UPI00141265CF|nr:hypothetical protein [Caulobacter sp. SLTY]NBB17325.1 hypothetical protein [Caulobacter sp. SLTY]